MMIDNIWQYAELPSSASDAVFLCSVLVRGTFNQKNNNKKNIEVKGKLSQEIFYL